MCHDFLPVFLYKIYRKAVFFSFISGEWVAYTTLLFGSTLVFRRAEGGCLAQSDLTQCLQYLPTCLLMAQ